MSCQEFITAREACQANIAVYIAHLPTWVNLLGTFIGVSRFLSVALLRP